MASERFSSGTGAGLVGNRAELRQGAAPRVGGRLVGGDAPRSARADRRAPSELTINTLVRPA